MKTFALIYCCCLSPVYFFIKQNNMFGWNSTAQSVEELICDGITLILSILAFIVYKLYNEEK
jgi:hypothetical protein